MFVLFSLVPESPRWMIAKGRQAKGHEELRRIAKRNETQLPENVTVTVLVRNMYSFCK